MTSEEVVFSAILRWIEHDPENRKDSLPGLLTCVRLPLLTPHFLSDKVAAVELIRSSHKCRYDENYSKRVTKVTFKSRRRDLLDEARDYHLMPERRPLLQSFKTKPRRCKDLVGVIYAVGGQTKSGNSLSTVEVRNWKQFNVDGFKIGLLLQVYDPILGRWRDAEAMSMLRSRVGVAVMRNRLYAIGGYNGTDRLNTVEVFDSDTKRWSKVPSMNCKRRSVTAWFT